MTLAGPVEFGPEILVAFFIFLVVIPGFAIAGVVMLLIAARRFFTQRRTPSEAQSGNRRRSWKFFAVVGSVLLLPFIGWRVQDYFSYRRAVESRLQYLDNVGFVIYEPAAPPAGYDPDADVNPYRDPPYIEHYMDNGVVMTQFAFNSGAERFLQIDEPCDPSAALSFLISGREPSQRPGYLQPQCRVLIETRGGHLVYGPGERDPTTSDIEMFTILGDTVVVLRFTVMYDGDLSEVPMLVDSLAPVQPAQLTDT